MTASDPDDLYGGRPDQVDQAIASIRAVRQAAAAADAPAPMARLPILIDSTGRDVALEIPLDLTDDELVELVAYMLMGLRASLKAQRALAVSRETSRIIVPR